MNLRQYRYFVGVAEHLSFSRAAERLNISQSALSRQIQLLEAELGLMLFNRIGRAIELTQAGHDLFQRCRAILNDVESIESRARELASGSGGILRVGTTPPALGSVVADVLREFRQRHSSLKIVLIEDSAEALSAALDEGRLDLAVMGSISALTRAGQNLFRIGVLAVVPPGHKLAKRPKISVKDLENEPLLLLKPQYITRRIFDGACHVAGIHPNVVFESDSSHSLLALARARMGTAVIPANLVIIGGEPNAIQLEYDKKPLQFMLSVVWDARRELSPSAQAFVVELHAAARQQ